MRDSTVKKSNAALELEPPAFRPTAEQKIIVDTAKTGVDFKIMAYAGAGKTSTLLQVADALPGKKGQYIAFNKEIVTDAKEKFPKSVVCSTAHGLAYGTVGRLYADRMSAAQRIAPDHIASFFKVEGVEYNLGGQAHVLRPAQVIRAAADVLQRFVKSADPEPSVKHVYLGFVPAFVVSGVDLDVPRYKNTLVNLAKKMWADLQAKEGICRFTHDHYLKLWQLTDPVIKKDFILFDEAQDADPVMLDVVNKQQCQRIICGDSYQAIYEWRGAVDALSLALHGKPCLHLSQSFRFGAAIACIADEILNVLGAEKMITGLGSASRLMQIEMPRAILCRTNGGVIRELLSALEHRKRPHVVGGADVLVNIVRGCQQLQDQGVSNHPELAGFNSWQELLDCITEDEDDLGSLKVIVDLVKQYGCGLLLSALNRTVQESSADVIISTAHRAKGREWSSVRISPDFKTIASMQETEMPDGRVQPQKTAELRLSYVAVTRAKQDLDMEVLV